MGGKRGCIKKLTRSGDAQQVRVTVRIRPCFRPCESGCVSGRLPRRRVSSNHWEPTTGSTHGDAGDCSPQTRRAIRAFGSGRGASPEPTTRPVGYLANVATQQPGHSSRTRAAGLGGPAQTARRPIPGPALRHYTPESTPPIRGIISVLGHRHPRPGSHARASRARSPGTGVAYCRALRFLFRALARALSTQPERALASRRFLARVSRARPRRVGGWGPAPRPHHKAE